MDQPKKATKSTYNQKRIQNSVQIHHYQNLQPGQLAHGKGNYLAQVPSKQIAPSGSTGQGQMNKSSQSFNKKLGSQEFLRKKSAHKKPPQNQHSVNSQGYYIQPGMGPGQMQNYQTAASNHFTSVPQQTQSSNANLSNNFSTQQDMSSSQGAKLMQNTVIINSPQMSQAHKVKQPSEIVAGYSSGTNGSLLNQAPLFIKVKSKTNANPTRQNSPRFSGKYSPSQALNPILRESNNSKTQKNTINYKNYSNAASHLQHAQQHQGYPDDTPPLINKGSIGLTGQMIGEMVIDSHDLKQPQGVSNIRAQMFSVPNSPNKGDQSLGTNTMHTNGTIGGATGAGSQNTSQALYSQTQMKQMGESSAQPQKLRQSIDKKVLSIQHHMKNNIKGNSTKNVYSQDQQTSNPPTQGSQRVQSSHQQTFSANRRLNSPKHQPKMQSGLGQMGQNSSFPSAAPKSQAGYAEQMTSQQQQMYSTNSHLKNPTDQKKYLNQAVAKNIGDPASGNLRRENRNKMMKQHHVGNENKSVVGSMGSMGSLGPFMGVHDGAGTVAGGTQGTENTEGYHTLKFSIDRQNTNKTNDAIGHKIGKQQINYSQLNTQQKHLSNLNPMFFATGEAALHSSQHYQKNGLNKTGQPPQGSGGNVGNQLMTMGGPQKGNSLMGSSPHHNQSQQQQAKQPLPHQQNQRTKKNSSQNYPQGGNIGDHLSNSQTYYDSTRGPQSSEHAGQVKASMIQLRKINPVSKTAVNGSKNTSIDRKKTNNLSQSHSNAQGGYKVIGAKQQQQIVMGNPPQKNFAHTTKVSYNNSPNNRVKHNGGGLVFTNQQLKQQPIGQPQGDLPLHGKMNRKTSQNGPLSEQQQLENTQNSNFQNEMMSDSKTHHLGTQSVLVQEQQAKGNKSQSSSHNYKKQKQYSKNSFQVWQQQTQQSANRASEHTDEQFLFKQAQVSHQIKQSQTAFNQHQSHDMVMNSAHSDQQQFMTPHLQKGGKLKLKVMSETNSPPAQLQSQPPNKIGGKLSGNESEMLRKKKKTGHNFELENSLANTQGSQDTQLRRSSAAPNKNNYKSQQSSQGGRSGRGNSGPAGVLGMQKQASKQGNQQQCLPQYYMKQKKQSYLNNNNQYPASKYSYVDSPKDGSIERIRQDDILMEEYSQSQIQNMKAVEQMNNQMQNMIPLNDMARTKTQDGSMLPTKSQKRRNSDVGTGNMTQHYILDRIEKINDIQQLSPRSKEVFLIKKLIVDCFHKYGKPPKTQLELYKIGKMLGKGAFGKVNLGLHRLTRKLVAIKSINMDFMKEESQKKKIMNEINILKSLRHPNNIKILETFQTDRHHMIVMELCPGGDLLNYVRKRRKLTEKYAKFVFRQIMEGIAYLHDNKVAHRDIKLDNILLDGHGNIKIGDFGVSRRIEENEVLFEQCGTPAYIAPEIVKDMGYKGFPVDVWSAGICLYAMLYGNVPFKANQIGDLSTVEQLNQDIEFKDTVSKEAIDLMKQMLQKVPKLRATAHDVLQHPWLEEDEDTEHIDIFDEQELELIRKEFTYVVQKKKLKDFKEQKNKLAEDSLPYYQASRKPDDLNTEFTECSIQTHENSLLKNDSSRSVILCPFNTQTGDKTADKILSMAEGLLEDKDLMIRFHPRVRELDRNYEKLNNQDFDNGVYHKYAYKQKVKKEEEKKEEIKEEKIKQSDVLINNFNKEGRKRKREKADINYHNYYIKVNESVIKDTERLGFPIQYIQKCIKDNSNNHCTTTYYLLCMDQNF